jgi:hypothetical protein
VKIPDSHRSQSKVIKSSKQIGSMLIIVGNSLTAIGCSGLMLALIGLIDAEFFALGISSGIRVIGSVAITGCLNTLRSKTSGEAICSESRIFLLFWQ